MICSWMISWLCSAVSLIVGSVCNVMFTFTCSFHFVLCSEIILAYCDDDHIFKFIVILCCLRPLFLTRRGTMSASQRLKHEKEFLSFRLPSNVTTCVPLLGNFETRIGVYQVCFQLQCLLSSFGVTDAVAVYKIRLAGRCVWHPWKTQHDVFATADIPSSWFTAVW